MSYENLEKIGFLKQGFVDINIAQQALAGPKEEVKVQTSRLFTQSEESPFSIDTPFLDDSSFDNSQLSVLRKPLLDRSSERYRVISNLQNNPPKESSYYINPVGTEHHFYEELNTPEFSHQSDEAYVTEITSQSFFSDIKQKVDLAKALLSNPDSSKIGFSTEENFIALGRSIEASGVLSEEEMSKKRGGKKNNNKGSQQTKGNNKEKTGGTDIQSAKSEKHVKIDDQQSSALLTALEGRQQILPEGLLRFDGPTLVPQKKSVGFSNTDIIAILDNDTSTSTATTVESRDSTSGHFDPDKSGKKPLPESRTLINSIKGAGREIAEAVGKRLQSMTGTVTPSKNVAPWELSPNPENSAIVSPSEISGGIPESRDFGVDHDQMRQGNFVVSSDDNSQPMVTESDEEDSRTDYITREEFINSINDVKKGLVEYFDSRLNSLDKKIETMFSRLQLAQLPASPVTPTAVPTPASQYKTTTTQEKLVINKPAAVSVFGPIMFHGVDYSYSGSKKVAQPIETPGATTPRGNLFEQWGGRDLSGGGSNLELTSQQKNVYSTMVGGQPSQLQQVPQAEKESTIPVIGDREGTNDLLKQQVLNVILRVMMKEGYSDSAIPASRYDSFVAWFNNRTDTSFRIDPLSGLMRQLIVKELPYYKKSLNKQ